ncbi:14935_t:CDS:2, partial [Acaulospora colombiana]
SPVSFELAFLRNVRMSIKSVVLPSERVEQGGTRRVGDGSGRDILVQGFRSSQYVTYKRLKLTFTSQPASQDWKSSPESLLVPAERTATHKRRKTESPSKIKDEELALPDVGNVDPGDDAVVVTPSPSPVKGRGKGKRRTPPPSPDPLPTTTINEDKEAAMQDDKEDDENPFIVKPSGSAKRNKKGKQAETAPLVSNPDGIHEADLSPMCLTYGCAEGKVPLTTWSFETVREDLTPLAVCKSVTPRWLPTCVADLTLQIDVQFYPLANLETALRGRPELLASEKRCIGDNDENPNSPFPKKGGAKNIVAITVNRLFLDRLMRLCGFITGQTTLAIPARST